MRSRGLVGMMVLVVGGAAYGQAPAEPHEAKTWDLFAGGSYVRLAQAEAGTVASAGLANARATTTSTQELKRTATGWDASVTERPYTQARWFGGTIEASGAYSSDFYPSLGTGYKESQNVYTIMGGPMVAAQVGRVQPFARILLGLLYTNTAVTGGTATNNKQKGFGYAMGGGLDFLVTPTWAVRVQGDYIRGQQSATTSGGTVRASVGGVYKF